MAQQSAFFLDPIPCVFFLLLPRHLRLPLPSQWQPAISAICREGLKRSPNGGSFLAYLERLDTVRV
jgi:hypothetical protein